MERLCPIHSWVRAARDHSNIALEMIAKISRAIIRSVHEMKLQARIPVAFKSLVVRGNDVAAILQGPVLGSSSRDPVHE